MIKQTIKEVDLLKDKVKRVSDTPTADFSCPLTRTMMLSPVVTSDGHTYERQAIMQWPAQHTTSPCTGLVLRSNQLVPYYALNGAIETFNRSLNARAAAGRASSGSDGGENNMQ